MMALWTRGSGFTVLLPHLTKVVSWDGPGLHSRRSAGAPVTFTQSWSFRGRE